MAFCTECGKNVDDNASFCNGCGAKQEVYVGGEQQPQQPQQQYAQPPQQQYAQQPQQPQQPQQFTQAPQGQATQPEGTKPRTAKKPLSSGKILGIVAVIAVVGGLAWSFMPSGSYGENAQGILDVENMTSEEQSDLKMARDLYDGFEDMLEGKDTAYVGAELTWVTDWEFDEKGKTMPIKVKGDSTIITKALEEEMELSADEMYEMVAEQEKHLSVKEYKEMIVELNETVSASSEWGQSSDFVLVVGEDDDGGLCIYAPEGNWGKALEIPTTLKEAADTTLKAATSTIMNEEEKKQSDISKTNELLKVCRIAVATMSQIPDGARIYWDGANGGVWVEHSDYTLQEQLQKEIDMTLGANGYVLGVTDSDILSGTTITLGIAMDTNGVPFVFCTNQYVAYSLGIPMSNDPSDLATSAE